MGDINLLKPIAVFEQLFEQKIRLDDRKNDDLAAFSISANVLESCHGSSLVQVGSTKVLCGAKVKVLPDTLDAGAVICNVELNSLANRSIHPNPSVPKEAQCLSSLLQRLIDTTVCPNAAKDLNIYAEDNPLQPIGSYVIRLDAVVLQDDGCLLDACVPAALVALLSLSWPKISNPVGESGPSGKQYRQVLPTVMQKLPVSDWPVTLSFCFIPLLVAERSGLSPVICQPSRRELALWDTDVGPGHITVSCNTKNVLQLSMTNAFLPSLSENLAASDHETKTVKPSSWQSLFDAAASYASKVKLAIQDALTTASVE